MCQQTQVATVIPYWLKWLARFPTIADLAQADEQDVLASWAGLGYYRRARTLHDAAKWISHAGFPKTYEAWLAVPGVGKYTAGAIASICFNHPTPAVDGNVRRVYARLNASDKDGGAEEWAKSMVSHERPGDWNQALMELGATICKPRKPLCAACPVRDHCLGKAAPEDFPRPKPQKPTIQLHRFVAICQEARRWAVCQAPPGQWGEGLWEFPSQDQPWDGPVLGEVKHVITRHRIRLTVQETKIEAQQWQTREEIAALPMGAAHRQIADRYLGD